MSSQGFQSILNIIQFLEFCTFIMYSSLIFSIEIHLYEKIIHLCMKYKYFL